MFPSKPFFVLNTFLLPTAEGFKFANCFGNGPKDNLHRWKECTIFCFIYFTLMYYQQTFGVAITFYDFAFLRKWTCFTIAHNNA